MSLPDATSALATLLDLSRQARQASSAVELAFLLVNHTSALVGYRQAALWIAPHGVHTLSGVVQKEANAPYVQWLEQVCGHMASQTEEALRAFTAEDLPTPLRDTWQDWWPAHALWLPLSLGGDHGERGGAVLVRDEPWSPPEQQLLQEWADTWAHAFRPLHRPRLASWPALRARWSKAMRPRADGRWWQHPLWRWGALVLLLLAFPVRLTVLAPGELVPARPAVVRAPLDGVVDTFHVQPNQVVRKGQPLFGFDEALIQSRVDVARQALAAAETEYRQASQQALADARAKTQLALLTGKIEEKRAEVAYLADQLTRARVLSPQDGVVLLDDPSEWIGRPVAVGERILRVAAPQDVEVEAWLPIADAIPLAAGAPVDLYLNASPLSPVGARVRYMAHDAVQRPDGQYAYRVRAALTGSTDHRVGLKGSAKIHGRWVPLAYWVLRRPLAAIRSTLGV